MLAKKKSWQTHTLQALLQHDCRKYGANQVKWTQRIMNEPITFKTVMLSWTTIVNFRAMEFQL